ncbi:MAG: NADH-quinone oxidoreductase subunit L [Akkermansiaceae bacterium]|nr:NADH-quinone oxidoreductase subunit L [Akkermansiaceae bacterium]MCP5542528.1 NADH-quinone oxidoreductase subunit L [Akkermansiaceae bacterium]MCP5547932.1 NADH-quinone oxidoreductase subunit L [Akkermansiaceae bacterium]
MPALLAWIPLAPLLAAGVIAFLPDGRGKLASKLAVGGLFVSLIIALGALLCTLKPGTVIVAPSFEWFSYGDVLLKLGFLLDPLSAGMAGMVTFVAMWIFIYSLGYMKEDQRFGRFFGFLSLFCGAMLAVVLSNSLLLLFMAWELVGLASYLLIGFHYQRPSAAAAAQKAFITTRVGDMAFLLGLIWLYRQTGTLLFFDEGRGLLETGALDSLAGTTTIGGLTVSAAASLLLLVGAMGKSGQVPLHVWLPDAMEGPTPVSALIHAATMVAAGVFLVARMMPVFELGGATGPAMTATAWIGGITALYAALVAVAQYDFKRILAYSTVSQLGFMMVALGTGGVAAAMFHLIAHAFFKALLFLSAGSVIHGCHEEQDIRKMGGLRKAMPKTFLAYAIGMMALAGFPFLFSGFWSKEAIFHSAQVWPGGMGPFVLTVCAALLTAFYMTRQALLVFFGEPRKPGVDHPHESPPVMTVPLFVLAASAVLLSLIGTPFWPWFEEWIHGQAAEFHGGALGEHGAIGLLLLSLVIVSVGVGASWMIYRKVSSDSAAPDPLGAKFGGLWGFLERAMGFDALYQKCVVEPLAFFAGGVDMVERMVFAPLMTFAMSCARACGLISKATDERALNPGFDATCGGLKGRAASVSSSQTGRPQAYLRVIGLGVFVLLVLYFWLGKS